MLSYSVILLVKLTDNYGISGLEKYFVKELKKEELLTQPLALTLDINIQHLVNRELEKALEIFEASGGGSC